MRTYVCKPENIQLSESPHKHTYVYVSAIAVCLRTTQNQANACYLTPLESHTYINV